MLAPCGIVPLNAWVRGRVGGGARATAVVAAIPGLNTCAGAPGAANKPPAPATNASRSDYRARHRKIFCEGRQVQWVAVAAARTCVHSVGCLGGDHGAEVANGAACAVLVFHTLTNEQLVTLVRSLGAHK